MITLKGILKDDKTFTGLIIIDGTATEVKNEFYDEYVTRYDEYIEDIDMYDAVTKRLMD